MKNNNNKWTQVSQIINEQFSNLVKWEKKIFVFTFPWNFNLLSLTFDV